MILQTFYAWCAARIAPKPTLQDDMIAEADRLRRDTIERQLRLIDDEHKIMANKTKAEFLLEQILK